MELADHVKQANRKSHKCGVYNTNVCQYIFGHLGQNAVGSRAQEPYLGIWGQNAVIM